MVVAGAKEGGWESYGEGAGEGERRVGARAGCDKSQLLGDY